MNKEQEPCKGEGCNSLYIQNKKKHLCSNCVFKLNHEGKSQQEVYNERSKKKPLQKPMSYEEQMFLRNKVTQDAITEEDEGERLFEQKILKQQLKRTQSPIKKTKKQTTIDSRLRLTYIDMDHTEEKVCSGCLRYQGGDIVLSHSHVISQKDCKEIGREDLIYDKNNLRYHCMDFGENEGCHRIWENPIRRSELKDYKKNMEFIKSVDGDLYLRYARNESDLF